MPPSKPTQVLREPGFTKREGTHHTTGTSIFASKEPGERSDTRRRVAETHKNPQIALLRKEEDDQGFLNDDDEHAGITSRGYASNERAPVTHLQSSSEQRRIPRPKFISQDSKPNSAAVPLPTHPTRSMSLRQSRVPKTSSTPGKVLARTVSSVTPRSGTNGTRPFSVTGQQTREPKPARAEDDGRRAARSSDDAAMHSQTRLSHESAEREPVKYLAAASDGPPSTIRPQFSSFQREFSPKKSKILPNSSGRASGSAQDTAATVSAGALQDELLQLQSVYHSSDRVFRDWARSGAEKIKSQQRALEQKANKIQSAVQSQQDCINAVGLRDWVADGRGQIDLSKVEMLDHCIRSLADISRSHGQYSTIVKRFEQWYEETRDILDGRSSHSMPEHVRAINQLDKSWKDAFPTLMHALESCLEDLDRLEPSRIDASSGLHQTVAAHQALAHGMVSELKVMEETYWSALQHDEQWLSNRVAAILDAGQESSSRSSQRQAAWE